MGRVDDQRGANLSFEPGHLGAGIDPERVVAAHQSGLENYFHLTILLTTVSMETIRAGGKSTAASMR